MDIVKSFHPPAWVVLTVHLPMATCSYSRRARVLLASLFCWGLFAADTSSAPSLVLGPLTVAAGPWMQLDERGVVTIAIRLVPGINQAAMAAIRPWRERVQLPVAPSMVRLPPDMIGLAGQVVVSWELPTFTSGVVRLGDDARSPTVTVPVPPGSSDPVRMVITGGPRWPTAEVMTAITARFGAPADAVLVVGVVAGQRYGTGGWESTVPIITRRGLRFEDPLTEAIVGPARPGVDIALGCLGLPTLESGPDIAVNLAQRPRAWNIILDPEASWDVGLQATEEAFSVQRHRTIFGIAKLLGIPLIIGGGSPTGFISEPLEAARGTDLVPTVGGVRYVAATPGGGGARALPKEVTLDLSEPATLALMATPERLTLNIPGVSDLEWLADREAPASGPGRIAVKQLVEAWRAKPGTLDPSLVWATRPELALGEWNVLEFFQLIVPSPGTELDPTTRLLLRRLFADPMLLGDEASLLARLPAWLRRDAILRWMAEPADGAHAWVAMAAITDDQSLVLALLTRVERSSDPGLLDILMRRLAAQATGSIAIDPDPFLQARLTTAVFDATTLSPTPLRPIARDLLPKLSPLGRAPVERFIARAGRFRSGE